MRGSPSFRAVVGVLAVAVLYYATARLGLQFATVTRSVTLVWPPTGLSLAALLLLGGRAALGVALGAFAVNALTPGVPPLVALGIASGNTLEALLGAALLRRVGFSNALERIQDVAYLISLVTTLSTTVGATIGVLSLRAGGVMAKDHAVFGWIVWWLGDLMGDLIFAPLALTWATPSRLRWGLTRTAEFCALMIVLVALGLLSFGPFQLIGGGGFPQPYMIFPLLVWAALRFGPRGAAAANFAASAISIWATTRGLGPFANAAFAESLLFLQTFMAVAALTSLFLGAAVAERDRAIGVREEFIQVASHELRTPITALKLTLQSLHRMLRKGAPSAATASAFDKMVARSERQVDRLTALVTDLLVVSKSHAGKIALERASMDLAELVSDTAEGFREQLAMARCELELSAGTPVVGVWDRQRLQQVLTNLITNAMKFGAHKPISISVSPEAASARLVIEDHGVGIEKAAQSRIFEKFERASSSRHYPGLGLGLYITREIVEAHGGSIEVKSEPGEGSRFIVSLPFSPSSVDGPAHGGTP